MVDMMDTGDIAQLPGLGPKSADMLARAGIVSARQLRALGSVRAYLQVRAAGVPVSLNLLWALEGALSGERWQDVARLHRTSLLMALEAAQD
jgi:DNA transformation protein